MSSIRENLLLVRERIERTLDKSGRKDEVTLIAVTKTVPPERINEALDEGVTEIGENRVQEAEQKYEHIKRGAKWHLVGHLQRNKVKKALPLFRMIQSIDKEETALEIQKRATSPVDILIEINSSGEASKSGIEPDNLFSFVGRLRELNMMNIKGLMTIGPFTDNERWIRDCFSLMRKKFEELKSRETDLDIRYLSMGMTADYEIAIAEGSNMVRIGTAIFGERTY